MQQKLKNFFPNQGFLLGAYLKTDYTFHCILQTERCDKGKHDSDNSNDPDSSQGEKGVTKSEHHSDNSSGPDSSQGENGVTKSEHDSDNS